jgi:membrane protein YdbS with pleckstrin-like domain
MSADAAPEPDELVIRPSQVINYGVYLSAALQMAFCAALFALLRRYWPMLSTVFLAIPLIGILGVATLAWLKTATTSYHFAKGRLTWRTGVLSRNAESLELYRVADVTMRQPLFQRLFGVGRVVLSSAAYVLQRRFQALGRGPEVLGQPRKLGFGVLALPARLEGPRQRLAIGFEVLARFPPLSDQFVQVPRGCGRCRAHKGSPPRSFACMAPI